MELLKALRIISIMFLAFTWYGCSDDELPVTTSGAIPDVEAEEPGRNELTLDSVFLYAKETYYWNDFLPEYDAFEPRSYNSGRRDELENLQRQLFDLSQFAINPETNRPFEFVSRFSSTPKYSSIDESERTDFQLASLISNNLDGTVEDYGFTLAAIGADDIRLRFVSRGSPADDAGLSRGDRLLEISGIGVRADSESDINRIIQAFDNSTFDLTVLKSDGTEFRTNLTKSVYTINPVLKDSVFETSSGDIGYLAFESFTSLSNARSALDQAFQKFEEKNISGIIVDLRYNGGGYLSTANYILNHIIPPSLDNQTMYIEEFNSQMQRGNATILENLILRDENGEPIRSRGRFVTYQDIDYSINNNTFTFSKRGGINSIKDVYVIISGETASASELIINSLKPYLNVSIIGSKSYGKPVGFFGIDIDKFTMYIPNFKTINANGESDYFDGFEPDYPSPDDVTRDFGDTDERSINTAISLANGSELPNVGSMRMGSFAEPVIVGNTHGFQGMIGNR